MEKKHNKAPLFIGLSIVAMAVIVGMIIIARSKSSESRLQEQLDLGYRYLSDLNYEQAVAAFEAVIEIDPKRIDGYVGLVEAYAGQNDASNMLDVYEMAETNLNAADADIVRQNIIDSVVMIIETARNDGDDILVEELLGILAEIDAENIERYRLQYASTEVADSESQASDVTLDTDAYLVRTDRIETESTSYMLYEYSEDGYEVNYYDSDGVRQLSVRYNEHGDVVYAGLGVDYESGMAITIVEYEYDDMGRCVSFTNTQESYQYGEMFYQDTTSGMYEYDSHGNYTMYYDDGRVIRVEVDDLGYEIYREATNSVGTVTITKSVNDSRGNVVMSENENGERVFYSNSYSDGIVLTYDNP